MVLVNDIIKSLFLLLTGSKNISVLTIIGSTESQYVIPARYRKMENMHIVFWLLKDNSWCMIWRELGLSMFIPTLVISIIIPWRNRYMKSELAHNLAITFWICANGYWMISDFFHFDTILVWRELSGKHMALTPFIIGAIILLHYYTIQRSKEIKLNRTTTM